MTASGARTFENRPSWRRPHIIISWIGQFAPALQSCRLLNPAMQGQPFSGICRNLRTLPSAIWLPWRI